MNKKVLVTALFTEEQKNRLTEYAPEIDFCFEKPENVTEPMLDCFDALIGNVAVNLLKDKENLEWIQLNSSGADAYALPGAVCENTVLTCATGAYGLAISEYMVGMLMLMMKNIPDYLEDQKAGVWKTHGIVESPYGKRVLLVGCGNIGLEFAKRMHAFGCELVGIRNRADICPPELDEVYGTRDLKNQVSKADVIALSLPGTSACHHLFDKEILLSCKEGAYLMNVGRGSAIDTRSLLEKEIYERFSGIWLDVCETEPLPEKDPLFYVPGMIITPHITGGYHLPQTTENIFEIACHNLDAWRGKGSFIHIVNRQQGYSLN